MKMYCAIIVLLLLNACASRPPAHVDEISIQRKNRQAQSLKHRKLPRKPNFYRVQKGDSLYSIGFRYNIDYRQLAAINNIKPPYTIHPNQRLSLTQPSKTTSTTVAESNKVKTSAIVIQPTMRASNDTKPITSKKPATTSNTPESKPKPPATVTVTKQPSPKPQPKPVVNLPKTGDLNWLWPTQGKIRTTFSGSNPARKGISIRGQEGQDVKAAEAGVVVYSGDGLLGYGELIIIKHNDSFLSAYGHNKKRHVKEGQQVKRGEVIAQLGSSGTNVDNLHFEIRKNGQPVNPLDYVKP